MAFSRKSMVASVAGSLSLAMLTGCPAPNPVGASPSPSTAPSASTPASTTPTGSPSATASPEVSPTASASASPDQTGTGTPSASPTVQTSAQPPSGKTTIVSGTVYDETGATVDGAVIKVNSLDTSVPYTATTTTSQGSWVVNSVPEGANVEIIASKDGWTSRRRVGSFQTQATQKNVVDFGGLGANNDQSGIAYFISKFPEIASVDPGYDSSQIDNSTISYKLTLSEPLDSTNQTRFANALRLFPANSQAAPDNDGNNSGAEYFDLKDQRIPIATGFSGGVDRPVDPDPTTANSGYSAANTPNHANNSTTFTTTAGYGAMSTAEPWDYSIKNGTLFLNDANTRANVTWDATGQVATLTFNAPLQADRTNQARYQVGLVVTSQTDRIVDKDNNQLGTDTVGSQSVYPKVGGLLHATIKQPDLSLPSATLTAGTAPFNTASQGAMRWVGTHEDAARFAVKVDGDNPVLQSVAYTKSINRSSRIELTFNKPMASYNGRLGGHVGTAIRDGSVLGLLSFAVSDRTGGTNNVNLKGGSSIGLGLDPSATKTLFGNATGDIEKEFGLNIPQYVVAAAPFIPNAASNAQDMGNGRAFQKILANSTSPDGSNAVLAYGTDIRAAEAAAANANDGHWLLAVNPSNAKTLFIYAVGRTQLFDTKIVELKVRAEGVPDPAGNTVKANDADNNQKVTSVQ